MHDFFHQCSVSGNENYNFKNKIEINIYTCVRRIIFLCIYRKFEDIKLYRM